MFYINIMFHSIVLSFNSVTQDSWFDFNTANFSSCSKMSSEDLVPWSSAFGAFSSAHTTGNIWGSSDLFANQSSGILLNIPSLIIVAAIYPVFNNQSWRLSDLLHLDIFFT